MRSPVASTSRPHVGSWDRNRVTCVIAKTKTRSKKSSSAVTSCSISTARSSDSARSACSSIVLPYSPAMPRQIVLLRGINIGSRNRIAMPALREAFADAGFEDVQTYLQSGNVVASSKAAPKTVARKTKGLIADRFGLDIEVVVRTRDELAEVVRRNPLGKVAKDPKRYQVSFLDRKPGPKVVEELAALATGDERLVADGREPYAWHPAGVARSKLWAAPPGPGLGVTATARNWTTGTKLP